jgi:hypothetical protein
VRLQEELRVAQDRQLRATDEISDIMKKEEKISVLLDQLHSFLHHGTSITVVEEAAVGGFSIEKRHLYLSSEGKECFLVLCRVDATDERTPLRQSPIEKICVGDIKKLDLGQFSDCFKAITSKAASFAVDELCPEAQQLRSIVDRSRMSFTVTARKKKRSLDLVCEDESDFEAWVIELNRLLGASAEWKEPLDISQMDLFDRLAPEEASYCAQMHIHPSEYLHAKRQMLRRREKFVTLFDVRSLTKFDLYHSQRFFYFMRTCGWISQAAMFYLTDKFQEAAYEEIEL